MHLISARPRPPQRTENGYVAKHHENKSCEDHHGKNLVKLHNVAHAFSRSIGQDDKPNQNSQCCSVLPVLELGEGDGVDHSHVPVQADARQKERREVFYAIEEAQDVPDAAAVDEDDASQLQGRDKTEQHI